MRIVDSAASRGRLPVEPTRRSHSCLDRTASSRPNRALGSVKRLPRSRSSFRIRYRTVWGVNVELRGCLSGNAAGVQQRFQRFHKLPLAGWRGVRQGAELPLHHEFRQGHVDRAAGPVSAQRAHR